MLKQEGMTACDSCGTVEGPFKRVQDQWDYCQRHAELHEEYEDGRRTLALLVLDQAVTLCLGEDFTEDEVRAALEMRLREGERVSQPEFVVEDAAKAVT